MYVVQFPNRKLLNQVFSLSYLTVVMSGLQCDNEINDVRYDASSKSLLLPPPFVVHLNEYDVRVHTSSDNHDRQVFFPSPHKKNTAHSDAFLPLKSVQFKIELITKWVGTCVYMCVCVCLCVYMCMCEYVCTCNIIWLHSNYLIVVLPLNVWPNLKIMDGSNFGCYGDFTVVSTYKNKYVKTAMGSASYSSPNFSIRRNGWII